MWKTSLKWGALLGAALAILEPIKMYAHILDLEENTKAIFILLQSVLYVALIFMAQKEFKEEHENMLSFARAYSIGMIVSFCAWAIFFAYSMFHFKVVEPDALMRMYNGEIDNILAGGMLYSMGVLLCGLLFDIFTAMYLYTGKGAKVDPSIFKPGTMPEMEEQPENDVVDEQK